MSGAISPLSVPFDILQKENFIFTQPRYFTLNFVVWCYMHVASGVAHSYMLIQVGVHTYTSVLIVTFIFFCYHCIVYPCIALFLCNLHYHSCINCVSFMSAYASA
jgi:hypothetical protein